MLLRINHQTIYEYDHPVTLGPTIFHLSPRSDPSQRCLQYSLNITPKPIGLTSFLDENGNTAHTAWFLNETKRLIVESTIKIETLRNNPFDFIITDTNALSIPVLYDKQTAALLNASIEPTVKFKCESLTKLVSEIIALSDNNTLNFLTLFCERLSNDIVHQFRESGEPLTPEETLSQKRGACRDVAIVFIEGCRMAGIAARFVSGYKCLLEDTYDHLYMHAWAEVFLPGAGWRGYDPSIGLAVSDCHVTLAAAPFSNAAAPISGTFRSSFYDVKSNIKAKVTITPLENYQYSSVN